MQGWDTWGDQAQVVAEDLLRMNPYDAYRANKIESGLLFQDFVVDVLLQTLGFAVVTNSSRAYQHTVGESRTGVEIKHDERFADTGNLWIEVAEKARPRPGDTRDQAFGAMTIRG